jgi:lysophospholipase L1-like esterase
VVRRIVVLAAALAAACGHSPTAPPDPGPPVIACPGSTTVRGVSQAVTFPAPTTTGGTVPVAITCTPASGSIFEAGTTPVNCSAVDALSRRSQCTLAVTVTPFVLSITKFVAFGDSFTEGQNGRTGLRGERFVDVPNAYPTQLQRLLNTEYPGQSIVVSNQGVGGEMIDDGLRRLPEVLSRAHADALLLLDGYNNLLQECPPRDVAKQGCIREIDHVVAAMTQCIRLARTPSFGIKYILVSTLTPPGPYVSGRDRRIGAEAIVQTNIRLSAVVRAEGAILVDPYPAFGGHEAAYVDEDGLHLRPAGYQVVAETFFAAIKSSVASSLLPSRWEY